MARRLRTFKAGQTWHLYQRSVNKEAIFKDSAEHRRFLTCVRSAATRFGTAVHGFAIMSTHYHLLVTAGDDESIPRTVQQFAGQYAQYFNKKHERNGHLFGDRYSARLIKDDRQLLTCSRYIDRNPVNANLVESPEQYKWTSFRAHGYGKEHRWLVDHPTFLALGATSETRRAVYRTICDVV